MKRTETVLRIDARRNTESRDYEPGSDVHPVTERAALSAEVGVMNAGLGWAKYRLAAVEVPVPERTPVGVGWPS